MGQEGVDRHQIVGPVQDHGWGNQIAREAAHKGKLTSLGHVAQPRVECCLFECHTLQQLAVDHGALNQVAKEDPLLGIARQQQGVLLFFDRQIDSLQSSNKHHSLQPIFLEELSLVLDHFLLRWADLKERNGWIRICGLLSTR